MRAAVETQVRGSIYGSFVTLAGATADVEREYAQAQLFVMSSFSEGFPNSLAEALAHGTPAVGFADCPGTNELIIPGVNGVLASGQNRVDALVCALDEIMSSVTLRQRMAEAAPDQSANTP